MSNFRHGSRSRWLLATFICAVAPVAVFAHPSAVHNGFAGGLGHPFSGLDHLLAMVAVGLWSVQRGGRAVWAVPAGFVGAMLVGWGLGSNGIALPFVEEGILVSVLLFGLFVAAAVRLPVGASATLAGVFALLHGHAHGAEMIVGADAFRYVAGFVVATVLLHGAGIGFGYVANQLRASSLLRYAGGGIAVAGALLYFV